MVLRGDSWPRWPIGMAACQEPLRRLAGFASLGVAWLLSGGVRVCWSARGGEAQVGMPRDLGESMRKLLAWRAA